MKICLGIGARRAGGRSDGAKDGAEASFSKLPASTSSSVNPHSSPPGAVPASSALRGYGMWHNKSRRLAVTATEQSVVSTVPVLPKPPATKALIGAALRMNKLFQDLPDSALDVIAGSMASVTVAAGTNIIKQGDNNAHEFYVLEEGACEAWVTGAVSGKWAKVQAYGRGSSFGELAMLYNAPRAATVRAVTRAVLWVMQRSVFNAVRRNFTEAESAEAHALLDSVPGIKSLPAHQRALLVDALTQVEFSAGSTVFAKGSPGDCFYLIKTGTAQVQDGTHRLAVLRPGNYFGERALLGAEVRAADVVATTKLTCYSLFREDFNELLGSAEELWRYKALSRVPLLYNLSEQQQWQLAKAMKLQTVTKNQVMFRKGDPGDAFYIIEEGAFTISDEHGTCLAKVAQGSCFGELALLRREARAATVVATTDGMVLVLSREMFTSLLGDLGQMRAVWRFEVLRRVPLLNELDAASLGQLAQALEAEDFEPGQDIIKEGTKGDRFYIVERGRLGVFKNNSGNSGGNGGGAQMADLPGTPAVAHITTGSSFNSDKPVMVYTSGAYFGELALLNDEPRAATVRALSHVCCLSFDREHFRSAMGPLLPTLTKRAEKYKSGPVRAVPEVDLAAVKVIATLGSGGFGAVTLVQYADKPYALKGMKKDFVMQQGLLPHVKREKNVMASCNSPFLVRLRGTAQDDDMIYFMMEPVLGGEMFAYLQTRTEALSEDSARFYAACVIMGLEYLHERDHVYRDLKPENLLLDSKGYLKITDFGFVKQVRRGTKTYTTCGTPEYLAPEIIMNKGHGQSADWWALGVLVFELVSGMVPFHHEDRLTMFRRICHRDLTFPRHFSNSLQDLLLSLLELTPALRLGSGKSGAAELKAHPWFRGFDWRALAARTLHAPYVPPPPRAAADCINFGKFPPIKQAAMVRQAADRHQGVFAEF
ncbi:hypothetical protein FOA52_015872 [Chlamydomonas sp. UWO 241]|nr:hypothetical protein FOA52_015872 [Chlamydomonas sp. UWO 241]